MKKLTIKNITKMFGYEYDQEGKEVEEVEEVKDELYTEYELGISRKHSNARYIGINVCSETHTYDLGKHSMSVEYIDFWANDKQLTKVIKKLSKYSGLEYNINKKEEV